MKSSIRITNDGNRIHAKGAAAQALFEAVTSKHRYAKYLDYIKNAGGNPTVKWFDEDWSPIGETVRKEMETAGLALVINGRIYAA